MFAIFQMLILHQFLNIKTYAPSKQMCTSKKSACRRFNSLRTRLRLKKPSSSWFQLSSWFFQVVEVFHKFFVCHTKSLIFPLYVWTAGNCLFQMPKSLFTCHLFFSRLWMLLQLKVGTVTVFLRLCRYSLKMWKKRKNCICL